MMCPYSRKLQGQRHAIMERNLLFNHGSFFVQWNRE